VQPNETIPGISLPRLLTLVAVAETLAVSPHTVRMWVRKGRLHPVRLCRRLLFNPADVERFISNCTTEREA
jgi:excisionase family DNA binding protein